MRRYQFSLRSHNYRIDFFGLLQDSQVYPDDNLKHLAKISLNSFEPLELLQVLSYATNKSIHQV